jgi:hypothetical protein
MDGHGSWLRDYLLFFKADGPEAKRILSPWAVEREAKASCHRKIIFDPESN